MNKIINKKKGVPKNLEEKLMNPLFKVWPKNNNLILFLLK